MLDLDHTAGTELPLGEYRDDFRARQWQIPHEDSWKLECGQHFAEPGFPSWDAFARGAWEKSLALLEEERDFLAEFGARAQRERICLYRVRVVDEPLTPYLQWELHLLRLRAEYGERIRVLSTARSGSARRLASKESKGRELLTLGARALYRIHYDPSGRLAGATRFSDTSLVAEATEWMSRLYDEGEDVARYFHRSVAPLPPPRVGPDGRRRA
ncbi:DUF6879 family protein [Streptomyces sulphureus]|uniref:DUF6879 family protein n=1 Tax=Streptomyces sulphureus TaxID=47758 RepID=UPI00035ECE18|nr:DUF6879 family protein [Streptomyces sulphureus]